MILLDSQTQFASDYIKPFTEDKKVQLPAGYDEKFEKWLKVSGVKSYADTPENIAEQFAVFLEKDLKADMLDIVDRMKAPTEEKAKMRALIGRGQVLLGSIDGGQTFDRLVTLDDVRAVKASGLMLLSPTMRSATTDLSEAIHQQTVFHILSNFAKSGVLAEFVKMDGDDILVKVSHPKYGQDTFRISTTGDVSKPLKYKSESTGAEFFESQIQEDYGTAQADINLQPMTEEEVTGLYLSGRGIDPTKHAAAIAGVGAGLQVGEMAGDVARASMLNFLDQVQAQKMLGDKAKGVALVNIMAAKARMGRQKAAAEDRAKVQADRAEKLLKVEKELKREQRAKEDQAAERRKQSQKRKAKMKAAAGAAAGGAVAAGGAITALITHLNVNIF